MKHTNTGMYQYQKKNDTLSDTVLIILVLKKHGVVSQSDTGVSLCVLVSNFMHLEQVFQVDKDLKIGWKISQHVTSDASKKETSNSRTNEDSMQNITWDASQDFS